jgi:hypothetical protein
MEEDEPCETATETACSTVISFEVNTVGSTIATETSTVTCYTAIGCSASVAGATATTTTSATATPTSYVVYPNDGTNVIGLTNIESEFDTLQIPLASIYTSTSATLGVSFWYLPLTDAQVATLQGNQYVRESMILIAGKS